MHETTTRDDESNELLTVVHVDVPPHICMPRLETTLFYGDWSLTTEAALQSACSTALVYLRKVNIVAIDGIHSAELKSCQRKLLEASSWSEAFQTHAAKLQSQLTAVAEEKEIPTAKKCPAVNLLSPLKESDAPLILQNIVKEKMPDISPCLATPNKLVEASASRKVHNTDKHARKALFAPVQPGRPPWLKRRGMRNSLHKTQSVQLTRKTRLRPNKFVAPASC